MGEKFSPISTFFSLVTSCAFKDAPHPSFRCRDPNQCLTSFLKMLLLALLQITHVYFTCGKLSICTVFGLDILSHITFFYQVSSCAFRDAPQSRFRSRAPNQFLPNFLEMLLLALSQIYARVFHLWKSIDLDSAWVRDSCPYQLFFLSLVLAHLEMRRNRV